MPVFLDKNLKRFDEVSLTGMILTLVIFKKSLIQKTTKRKFQSRKAFR